MIISVPEVAPGLIECTGVSSTALRVSWRTLPQHLQGGAMLGYTLFYTSPGKLIKCMNNVTPFSA